MLNLIRIFERVVEHGSFSKAARVLKVAPSSVTRSIDNLESELGVSLFKRSTRQLMLTEEGVKFKEEAHKLLVHADEIVNSLKKTSIEPEGVLRISVFETFGRIKISPLISDFLKKYPKLKVEFDLENRMVDLNQEDIDIAIRIGRPVDSRLRARKLMPNDTLICASPEYARKHGTPEKPRDLISHNCLALNTNRQKIYWYFKKDDNHEKISINGNLTSASGTPLLEAVLQGAGLVQIPLWMASEYIQTGRLVKCLEEWSSYIHDGSNGMVYALYKNSNYLKPSIRAFIDYVVEKLSEESKYKIN